MSLAGARLGTAEVQTFTTGEVEGFDHLVFKIDQLGLGETHGEREILRFLRHNRSLEGDNLRTNTQEAYGPVGAEIDREFMADLVRDRLGEIEGFEDPFDDVGDPGDGYRYDMRITHPGSEPGVLEGFGRHPIIIMAEGFTGGTFGLEAGYDWLAEYYAEKGYIFARPRLLENFLTDPRTEESSGEYWEIYPFQNNVYSLQISDAIDYLADHFPGKVKRRKVTIIGHSNGGFTAVLAATQNRRISRMVIFSGSFNLLARWTGERLTDNMLFVMDSYDGYRYLNETRSTGFNKLALHVQQFTGGTECMGSARCPEGIPCDPCVDRGVLYDLAEDPWIPYLGCDGGACDKQLYSFYQWKIYEGPKTPELKQIPEATHGLSEEEGRQKCLMYLDEFFDQYPVN